MSFIPIDAVLPPNDSPDAEKSFIISHSGCAAAVPGRIRFLSMRFFRLPLDKPDAGYSYEGPVEDLPRNVDYNNGDTVVTTGYTSSFPKNVPVGRVVDTFDGGGSFLTLHVELFSNFNRLNAVHVIFNKEQEERDQLQASVSANE